MKKDLKKLYPQWCAKKHNRTQCVGLDLDAILSASIEHHVHGYEINYVYTFNGFWVLSPDDKRKVIGYDMALLHGYVWDNHVTMQNSKSYVNPNSANLNAIFKISTSNYTEKYAGSTALQLWAYHKLPLPPTDEGKMLLLTIDSAFLGHYNHKFKEVHNEYLRTLGFEELIDLLERKTLQDFKNAKINEIVTFKDGYLSYPQELIDHVESLLGIKLMIPQGQFTLVNSYAYEKQPIYKDIFKLKENKVLSLAYTSKNYVKYTEVKQ